MHLDHIDKATVIKHQKRKFIISQNFSVKKPVNSGKYMYIRSGRGSFIEHIFYNGSGNMFNVLLQRKMKLKV